MGEAARSRFECYGANRPMARPTRLDNVGLAPRSRDLAAD
jgi:hypothetical protein